MKKIKIAAVKFAFFANGGTEKYIQSIVSNLPKDKFEIDVYYTNAAPYIGSNWKHPDNDINNINYVKSKDVNIIPVHVDYKDITKLNHLWVGTDFFELFDETKYDLLLTAVAGHSEYPYCEIKNIPIIEIITLPGMSNRQENIIKSVHISNFQLETWVRAGGDVSKTAVIPLVTDEINKQGKTFRQELNIPNNAIVCGFHQREDDGIWSPVALEAYKKIMNKNTWFLLMGGSNLYSNFAEENKLINFIRLPFTGDKVILDKFLSTLNVFTHSRKDGETFGLSIAEAMSYGLPIISHVAPALGHIETIGNAGFVCKTIEEYSNCLIKILNYDNGLYDQLSNNAIKKYKSEYTIKPIIEKYVKIFEEVTNKEKQKKLSDEDYWENMWG